MRRYYLNGTTHLPNGRLVEREVGPIAGIAYGICRGPITVFLVTLWVALMLNPFAPITTPHDAWALTWATVITIRWCWRRIG